MNAAGGRRLGDHLDALENEGRSRCPACARPGFVITARLPGRPCGWCSAPTRQMLADERRCAGCGHLERRPRDDGPADPAHCDACNP